MCNDCKRDEYLSPSEIVLNGLFAHRSIAAQDGGYSSRHRNDHRCGDRHSVQVPSGAASPEVPDQRAEHWRSRSVSPVAFLNDLISCGLASTQSRAENLRCFFSRIVSPATIYD